MEATARINSQARLLDAYRWLIVVAGAAALIASSVLLHAPKFDWRFLILASIISVNNLKMLMVEQPVHYVLIPVWAIVAYALIGFRAPKRRHSGPAPAGQSATDIQRS